MRVNHLGYGWIHKVCEPPRFWRGRASQVGDPSKMVNCDHEDRSGKLFMVSGAPP